LIDITNALLQLPSQTHYWCNLILVYTFEPIVSFYTLVHDRIIYYLISKFQIVLA